MINLKKVKPQYVEKYLKHLGLETTGTLEEQTKRLEDSQAGIRAVVKCDVCDGVSDESYEECPFCGDDEADGPLAKAEAPKAAKKSAGKKKTAKKESKKATKASSPKKTAAKKADKKSTKLAKVDATATEVLDVARLDDEVQKIKLAQEAGMQSIYEVGKHLLFIRRSGLHTQRLDEKGKPLYTTWSDFVRTELGMSRSYASKIMDAVDGFAEEDVKAIGVGKLWLLIGLKDQTDKDALLEKARGGATRKELQQHVDELGDKAREQRPSSFTGTRGEGKKPKADPVPSDTITTLVSKPERVLQFMVDGKDKPAKTISSMPIAQELTDNGCLIRYQAIKNEDGTLSLKITTSRSEG